MVLPENHELVCAFPGPLFVMRTERHRQELKGISDDELLRAFAASRNEDYFTELFQRHGRKVFVSCYAFLKDAGQAEDVCQEVFLQAYRNLHSFTEGNVVAWLLRIARNRCIDRWRARTPDFSDIAVAMETAISSSNDVVGSAAHMALLQLERELPALPPRQQECLKLKAEGYSYEETAAHIGCSADEVRSHLQNGRRTLRIRMGEYLAGIS